MGRPDIKDAGVKFSSENQPANRGRKKGSKNRSTLLKKWLSVRREIEAKQNPKGVEVKGTVEDEIVLALIQKAIKGDVAAIREIQDSMYGKIADKTEGLNLNLTAAELAELSDNELDQLINKLARQ